MGLWTPADVTTAFWLDASDASTFTLTSGYVDQWRDKSGSANHASPSGGLEYHPKIVTGFQNGRDVVQFDSLDSAGEHLTLNAAVNLRDKVVGVVSACTGSSTYYAIFGSGGNVQIRYASGSALEIVGGPEIWGNSLVTGNVIGVDDMAVLSMDLLATSGALAVNGTVQATAGAQSAAVDITYIGRIYSGYYLYGKIAEIVIADAGEVDREKLEGYLAHKWGLQNSLPVAHPYKEAPPTEGVSVLALAVQPWSMRAGDMVIEAEVVEPWALLEKLSPVLLAQPWGLKLAVALRAAWSDPAVRRGALLQPWQDAGQLAGMLVQPWREAVGIAADLDQPWTTMASAAGLFAQQWALAGDAVAGALVQSWRLPDRDLVGLQLAEPWSLGADPALLRYTVAVTVGGVAIGPPESLTIDADLDQDAIACSFALADLADFQRCADGATVVVRCGLQGETPDEFHLVVTSARIDERWGEIHYQVECESPVVHRGEPWAVPLDGEQTGLASTIGAGLAAPLALDWQTVDWMLPAGALVAAAEAPLTLLKRLAGAVGAVVQSAPDGSVLVAPEYRVSLPAWPSAVPDLVWIETEQTEQQGGQPSRRAGYNKVLIGETLAAVEGLRLEEETVSETVKLVRGYQVPWIGAFSLVHTGGSWVQVEDLGVETRQETETVEIVAGEGRVRYPIVSRDSVTWLQTNLGALTISEDGTVRSDVAGQSLARITYTTRCRKWRVRDSKNEQLQLVAEL